MERADYGVTQAYHDGYQAAVEDVLDVIDDIEWRVGLDEARLVRQLRNAVTRLQSPVSDDEAYSLVP